MLVVSSSSNLGSHGEEVFAAEKSLLTIQLEDKVGLFDALTMKRGLVETLKLRGIHVEAKLTSIFSSGLAFSLFWIELGSTHILRGREKIHWEMRDWGVTLGGTFMLFLVATGEIYVDWIEELGGLTR
ncbi:hypothetical protein L195_g007193 [Trifolium pratense]|uniref:Uncharacterized protein n=1 Tax=Trifolium pratense TaxID=57577 RepID=A0A2K3P5Q3_TRIPR|nr:hypothetical protein L195_g007193 [Trifolium pratense]